MPGTPEPQRIAVLGGGMSALTAAWELARIKVDGQPKYKITVFQQGWRLGGKGASGRNVVDGHRIEEHGLHIWFGAYENAFRTMTEVYAERPDKWPHGQLKNAFQEQFSFQLTEKLRSGWDVWNFPLLARRSVRGDGSPQGACTPKGVLSRLGSLVADQFEAELQAALEAHLAGTTAIVGAPAVPTAAKLRALAVGLEAVERSANTPATQLERQAIVAMYDLFRSALAHYANALVPTAGAPGPGPLGGEGIRRILIVMVVALAVITGTLTSTAFDKDDWDELNAWDLRAWLRVQLGPAFAWMADSALVDASYDLYFSYPGGNTNQGSVEAGSMLRAAVWLLLEYKGAFMWRMLSGMGDSIFAPIYHALEARGVEFSFFHKVRKLCTDGTRITGITVEEQAILGAGVRKYQPFVKDPLGCDCWPSRPDFAQLRNGVQLAKNWDDFDLESDWSTWTRTARHDLIVDDRSPPADGFHHVVLGIPLAALGPICSDLPSFGPMLTNVKTVQTQALQLWMQQPLTWLQGHTGRFSEPPVLTTFANPIDTYADMTHVVGCENFPGAGARPRHLAYFCGVLEDGSLNKANPQYPAWAKDQVLKYSLGLFEVPSGAVAIGTGAYPPMRDLWPAAFPGGKMDWTLLSGSTGSGAAALATQFMCANVNASDRYNLAAADTSRFRLKAGGSGYTNLFLAGDWIYNGLFMGCIEGAVISGKQAARALSGEQIAVVGEGNMFKRP